MIAFFKRPIRRIFVSLLSLPCIHLPPEYVVHAPVLPLTLVSVLLAGLLGVSKVARTLVLALGVSQILSLKLFAETVPPEALLLDKSDSKTPAVSPVEMTVGAELISIEPCPKE